jgi:hypothetical protein
MRIYALKHATENAWVRADRLSIAIYGEAFANVMAPGIVSNGVQPATVAFPVVFSAEIYLFVILHK